MNSGPIEPKLVALRPREKEILPLMADGYRTREIADHLYLSQNTVSTYIGRMRMELRSRNLVQLITRAIHLQIVIFDEQLDRWVINEDSLDASRRSRRTYIRVSRPVSE